MVLEEVSTRWRHGYWDSVETVRLSRMKVVVYRQKDRQL